MDNEIQKLKHAKTYMDYLANGVDPISNTEAYANTINNLLQVYF